LNVDLSALEQALLRDPFDTARRLEYATVLLEAGDAGKAEHQYSLVLRSEPSRGAALVGLARSALALGRSTDALEIYQRARSTEDFQADEELERIAATAQPSTPQFRVVPGGKATVTEIRREDPVSTGFADVAGMETLKKLLRMQIIEPFRNPGLFQRFRKKAGGGVLLYGPPGCGKTLIARAIAGECRAHFQSVGISDVLNMWIGESERNLAAIFEQARARRPCVLFFDEFDALAYSRSKAASGAARTVVNEFLSQMDGFNADNEGVLVLAATNMPWDVDPAMKRPGRFARQVFVPPPDEAARAEMLRAKLEDVPTGDVDVTLVASRTENFSGADIDGLIDAAKNHVLSDILDSKASRKLETDDLLDALDEISPSTVDWLKTARNLVKFAGADSSYREVEKYLRKTRLS
jgi:SpoVK/Ycf46/Vps4 family AAA+-type ATPase